MKTPVIQIVSGGQTGADRGGLDAAVALGIEHRGWCPAGRRAEDGTIPGLYTLAEPRRPGEARRQGGSRQSARLVRRALDRHPERRRLAGIEGRGHRRRGTAGAGARRGRLARGAPPRMEVDVLRAATGALPIRPSHDATQGIQSQRITLTRGRDELAAPLP